jgi:hypothetical protein
MLIVRFEGDRIVQFVLFCLSHDPKIARFLDLQKKAASKVSLLRRPLVDIDEKIQDWMLFEFRPIYLKPMDYHTSSDTSDTKRFCVSMHRSGDRYNIDYSKTNYSNQFSITMVREASCCDIFITC